MRIYSLFLLLLILISCDAPTKKHLEKGRYRAELKLNNTEVLPFNFEVVDAHHINVFNAEETILVDEITYKNDSVFIEMPVFEGVFKAKITDDALIGSFVVAGKQRIVPFLAKINETRFSVSSEANVDISGNWETVFSPDSETDRYKAKGEFKQNGNQVTGTFRTETGDYRYLEGVVSGDSLKLSTFDGAHAFLFTAKVTDSTLRGVFYSGNHWKEPFEAKRNESFKLTNAETLTHLKPGYETLDFSFPNEKGELVSLKDEQFKHKVVVVQIMGTWCPNCLDESLYYSQYYNANKNKDFEIVALAFEYAKTQTKAFESIKRLKDRVGIKYPILLAQTGTTSKKKAQEKLPMLDHVLSYPTTLFIDKKGKVRKIHTGFNGPATGEAYVDFKINFEAFIEDLLSE